MTTDLRLPLVVGGLLGVFVAVWVAGWPVVDASPPPLGDELLKSGRVDSAHGNGAELGMGIVSRDPFRLARRPALPAYDPLRLAEQLAPPPRPPLVLVGVLDGRPASAVIEGVPGVEGSRVIRVGDVIGSLTVKAVSRAGVVITGMDTTWVLQVREPWKP
jgi:hypothetical protein